MADVTTLGMAVDSTGVQRATADLEKMTPAGAEAAASATSLEKSMRTASIEGHLLGEGIADLIRKAGQLVVSFVELGFSIGRYADLAVKVGSEDPAGLASMQTAADVAGTSVDAVATAMTRMARQLGTASEETGQQAAALKSLNIQLSDFKKLDGPGQFRLLSQRLNEYGESQSKVQAVQAITGRGGAEMLLFLKEYGTQTESHIKLTNEQIRAADDLEDQMTKNRSEMRQTVAYIAAGVVPVLGKVIEGFQDWTKEIVGAEKEAGTLAANKGVQKWASDAATSLSYMLDAMQWTVRGLTVVGKSVGALFAILQTESFVQFKSVMRDLLDDLTASNPDTAGQRIRQRLEELANEQGAVKAVNEEKKKSIDFDPAAIAAQRKAAKEAAADSARKKLEVDKFIESLAQKQQAEDIELQQGARLTDAQRTEIDLMKQLRDLRVTGPMRDALEQQILNLIATKELNEERKENIKLQKEELKLAIEAAEAAELAIKKAQERESRENPVQGAHDAIEDYMAEINDLGTATRRAVSEGLYGVEDELTSLFSKGKMDARGLIDFILSQFVRLAIVRPMLNSLLGGGSGGGAFGLIGSIFKGFMGGGASTGAEMSLAAGLPVGTFAAGGSFGSNSVSQVAERGPELAHIGGKTYMLNGGQGGSVTPAHRVEGGERGPGGSLVFAPSIRIDSRSDAGQVASNVRAAINESQKAMLVELRAQGVIR